MNERASGGRSDARKKLRGLADLIQPAERKVVTTDFEDEIGAGDRVDLPDVGTGFDKARFRMKARRFTEEHSDHIALQKIKRASPVTQKDLDELGSMMLKLGVVNDEELASLTAKGGLAVFLRRLTGLDRAAAKEAFSTFAAKNDLKADQNEFLGMLIDFLTETGVVEPSLFYESPFTDIDDLGISGVFSTVQAKEIISIVARLNQVEAA